MKFTSFLLRVALAFLLSHSAFAQYAPTIGGLYQKGVTLGTGSGQALAATGGTATNLRVTGSTGNVVDISQGTVVLVSATGSRVTYSGTTDATRGAALSTAIATGTYSGDTILVGPGNYYMGTSCNLIASGVTYKFFGSYLYMDTSSTGTPYPAWMFFANTDISNWNFIGPVKLDGGSTGIARSYFGMTLQSATNRVIRDVTFTRFSTAFSGQAGSYGNIIESCIAEGCTTGFAFPGEYWRVTDCVAKSNTTGFANGGGNNNYSNCSANGNTTGFEITNGTNAGHGVWIGGNCNHNTKNMRVAGNLIAGFTIVGMQAYAGTIDLGGATNSGIFWNGGSIDGNITCTSGTIGGLHVFEGVRFPNADPSTYLTTLTAPQRAQVKLVNCTTFAGLSVASNELWANSVTLSGSANGAIVTGTLASGTATVANSIVTGSSAIMLSYTGTTSDAGHLSVGTQTSGTFSVLSTNASDTSTFKAVIFGSN